MPPVATPHSTPVRPVNTGKIQGARTRDGKKPTLRLAADGGAIGISDSLVKQPARSPRALVTSPRTLFPSPACGRGCLGGLRPPFLVEKNADAEHRLRGAIAK